MVLVNLIIVLYDVTLVSYNHCKHKGRKCVHRWKNSFKKPNSTKDEEENEDNKT